MRLFICAVAIVTVASTQIGHGAAQVSPDAFMVYGPTDKSCGAWTASSGSEREALTWWTLGFVSGADFQRTKHLAQTDSKGIEGWVDKYCAEHPLATFLKAMVDLVAELGGTSPR